MREILRGTKDFVWSPVAFFERRLHSTPNWWLAAVAIGLCIALQAAASLQVAGLWREVQDDVLMSLGADPAMAPPMRLFAMFSALGYPMMLGIAVLALLSMNVLYNSTGNFERTAELSSLCLFTQIPALLFFLPAVALADPEPLRLPSAAQSHEVMAALRSYQQELRTTPLLATSTLLSYYATIWFVAQLTCVLKVVGRFSTRATVAAGCFLLLLFLGVGSTM